MSKLLRTTLSGLAIAGLVGPLSAADRPQKDLAQNSSVPAPVIRISKETTRVTGPVDADGYVNFLAALNEHYGQNVALSENAAELLLEAIGVAENNPQTINSVRQALGMPLVNNSTRDFVLFPSYSGGPGSQAVAQQKLFDTVLQRPWSETEFPQFAAVLQKNAGALALVHKAVQRPKYFRPFTLPQPNATLISVLLPDLQRHREIGRQLKARAMLKMQAGQLESARQDLYDMHLLARCSGQGMSIIEGLVGIAVDAMASNGDNVWANLPGVTAEQLAAYRQQLAALPSVTDFTDRVDHSERLMFLDVVQKMANGTMPPEETRGILGSPEDASRARSMFDPSAIVQTLSLFSIDWNVAMSDANAFYDSLVAAGRVANRSERLARYNQWEQRLKQEKVRFAGAGGTEGAAAAALRFAFGSSKSRGRDMGSVLCTLLLPAMQQASAAEDAGRLRLQMTQLAFGLAEYRLANGNYPESLADLAPQWVPAIPDDVFNGKPLSYATDGASYLLYSVGRNGRDDGGSAGGTNGADDIAFGDPVVQ